MDSRVLKKLETWRLEEKTLPVGVLKADLQKAISLLTLASIPATVQEKAVFVRKMMEFAKAFQIPTTEAEAAVPFYDVGLADVPGDLLEVAHDRIVRDWKWNKLPKPADILEMIDSELKTRKSALMRAQNAVQFGEDARTEAAGPKGDDVRLKDEYGRLGIKWPGYEHASWLVVVGAGDEIGEKNE